MSKKQLSCKDFRSNTIANLYQYGTTGQRTVKQNSANDLEIPEFGSLS